MHRIYEKPSKKTVMLTLSAGSILAMVSLFIMYPTEVYLKGISPYGVIDLEFMWNAAHAEEILSAWGPAGIQKELFVTYVDYLYMLGYAFALGMCDLLLVRSCNREGALSTRTKSILPLGVILPFASAGFDALENLNLIVVLLNPKQIPPIHPVLASVCASMKFASLFLALAFLIFTVGLLGFKGRGHAAGPSVDRKRVPP